jgi:hypothetical protein
MAFILTADQMVDVSVAFVDDHGNPATVDGMPVWASSDDTILSVIASADGMSATVSAVGPAGQAQVSVTADADLGAGTVELIGLMDIQVVAGDAVSAVLTPGTPTSNAPQVQPISP